MAGFINSQFKLFFLIALKEWRDTVFCRRGVLLATPFVLMVVGFGILAIKSSALGKAGIGTYSSTLLAFGPTVLQLLSMGIAYDAIIGEKERRTLPLVLSRPISKTTLLLGKFVGLTISSCIIPVLLFSLGFLIVALKSGQGVNTSIFQNNIFALLLLIPFMGCFVAIGLLVSSISKSVKGAIIGIIFVFILFNVLNTIGYSLGAYYAGNGMPKQSDASKTATQKSSGDQKPTVVISGGIRAEKQPLWTQLIKLSDPTMHYTGEAVSLGRFGKIPETGLSPIQHTFILVAMLGVYLAFSLILFHRMDVR